MKLSVAILFAAVLTPALVADEHPQGVPADHALALLMEGNRRFAAHKETHPGASIERRLELTKGQNPYAVIVGCADSRVPPELIFDAGLGDLFVIREAGNVADNVVFGSVEYAVEHLGVKLVMVLGHEQCGAVTAAVKHTREAHISAIVKAIQPAVEQSRNQPGDPVHNCVLANARLVAKKIREAKPILNGMTQKGGLKVTPAYYDLETGLVKLIE